MADQGLYLRADPDALAGVLERTANDIAIDAGVSAEMLRATPAAALHVLANAAQIMSHLRMAAAGLRHLAEGPRPGLLEEGPSDGAA